MKHKVKTTRKVAPEDMRPGDYVTVAHETAEFIFCLDEWRKQVEPTRVTFMPDCAGQPLRVVSVCLPYVLVRTPERKHETLDLRRHHLVRLSRAYGKQAFDRLGKSRRKGK